MMKINMFLSRLKQEPVLEYLKACLMPLNGSTVPLNTHPDRYNRYMYLDALNM